MTDDSRDTPVVLSRIYTRTGDDGTTALADGARVAKTDPRLAAYADTDEANCAIGVAITLGGLPDDMVNLLRRIQNELFDAGADLATPLPTAPPEYPQLRIDESYVTALEAACDEYNAALPTLRSLRSARRNPRRGPAAHGKSRNATRRAHGLVRGSRPRRHDQPLARQVPEPPVRPAVHPRESRQREYRRHPLASRRRPVTRNHPNKIRAGTPPATPGTRSAPVRSWPVRRARPAPGRNRRPRAWPKPRPRSGPCRE